MNKPPYRIPTMAEIKAVPPNGFNVISTFSGCGGSCLGFKMAGFKVLWANEFIPAAQDTYRANHPDTALDTRDIRTIRPEDVRAVIGDASIDVLEGSPPCASFSTSGNRQKDWGQVKKYSDTRQRTDDLFFEFIRLLKSLQPKTFIAENVNGLIKGAAKGYFLNILEAMKKAGYNVYAQLLDAKWLGVPQSRQRVIFFGTRLDLGVKPRFPKPFAYQYTVRDALPNLFERGMSIYHDTGGAFSEGMAQGEHLYVTNPLAPSLQREYDRSKTNKQNERYFNLIRAGVNRPSPAVSVTASQGAGVVHPLERRRFTIDEVKRIASFPEDFVFTGTYKQQWERVGRAVPPLMMYQVALCVREVLCAG